MFAKALIILLLGSALVLGNPLAGEEKDSEKSEESVSDKLSKWWSTTVETVKSLWELGVSAVKADETRDVIAYKLTKLKEIVVKAINEQIKAGKEKWEQWKEEAKMSYVEAAKKEKQEKE